MKVKKELHKEWKSIRRHGDIKSISEESGFSKYIITKAFEDAEANQKVIQAISSFYIRRRSAMEKYVQQLRNPVA